MKSSLLAVIALTGSALGQNPLAQHGTPVPVEVRTIYDRGLENLRRTQGRNGLWQSQYGITGICVMAFLASGEDPNYGPDAEIIRRAVRGMLKGQNTKTGYLPSSMYHHGFAMLGLAEAYGALDEELLWAGQTKRGPSIAAALDLAVRCALTAQKKNRHGGWRYSPSSSDSDTSVSGAVAMGLLAARNAGIEVADSAVDRFLQYYAKSTSKTGMVSYAYGMGGFGDSMNRSSICTLLFAVARRKDTETYRVALEHIRKRIDYNPQNRYPMYFRYYMSQALFQADLEAWKTWNKRNIRALSNLQGDDGGFSSSHGRAYGTGMALLSLALNFRLLPIYER